MTGKTHVTVGLCTMLAFTVMFPSGIEIDSTKIYPAIGILSSIRGSYIPDIDIYQSALGRRHKLISKILKHRGITHTLVMPVMLMILTAFIFEVLNRYSLLRSLVVSLLVGYIIGWVMHIFADMFNYKGVPILYPLSKRHIHIATVKTRHWTEMLWLVVFIIVTLLITLTVCIMGAVR